MKRCPTCARLYADGALRFCRHDGARLEDAPDDATRLLGGQAGSSGGFADEGASGGFASDGFASDDAGAADDAAQSAPDSARTRLFAAAASARAQTSSSLTAPLARRRAPRKTIDSLAVLPFANESADPNAEYLCDGIAESVINALSQLPRLRVLPRAAALRYKGGTIDPQEAGRALGVRAVLTGRVVEVGRWLVVKTELVDVEQESHLWGEQYRREPADIFELQEELSRAITEKLRPRLAGEARRKLSKRYTENAEAYHAYLRGRYYVTSKRTEDWIRRGIESFQRAIDLDPSYALAYSGLADAYAFLASSTGEREPREAYPKAKAAALRALELDPALAEAHASLGFSLLLYDWDFAAAARSFRRALKLNPNYANTHDGLGFYYKATGQHERAVKECEESRRLDPLSPFPEVSLGWAYYFARDYERAARQGEKALELDPRSAFAYWIKGVAHAQAGRANDAVAALERASELSGGGLTFRAHLGHAYALAGREREARRVLVELEEQARARYVSSYYPAIIRLGLGHGDAALDLLERARDERSGFLAFLAVEPILDPLRDEPRFRQLVSEVVNS